MSYREKIEDWVIVDKLTSIILQHVRGCVIDIGIGQSTLVLAKHTARLGVKHYSCDFRKKLCNWAEREVKTSIIYFGDSLDFLKWLPDEPVAIVFLDASHRHHKVIKDVHFFLKRLSLGGIIFIHDTYPPPELVIEDEGKCGDVYKTRQELERDNSIQIFTWPWTAQNCGLTMIMKKDPDAPFCRK